MESDTIVENRLVWRKGHFATVQIGLIRAKLYPNHEHTVVDKSDYHFDCQGDLSILKETPTRYQNDPIFGFAFKFNGLLFNRTSRLQNCIFQIMNKVNEQSTQPST